MKKLIFPFLLAFPLLSKAQLFISNSSKVDFFSATSMEDIKAVNVKSSSLINTTNNEVVFKVPNSGFKFESSLMEEHFHENYMETAKYQFTDFKGKINEKIDWKKDGTYNVTVTGKMKLHGVETEKTYKGTVIIKGNTIVVDCKFDVALKEYNIKIPSVVSQNIAEVIPTTVHFEYIPYVKKS